MSKITYQQIDRRSSIFPPRASSRTRWATCLLQASMALSSILALGLPIPSFPPFSSSLLLSPCSLLLSNFCSFLGLQDFQWSCKEDWVRLSPICLTMETSGKPPIYVLPLRALVDLFIQLLLVLLISTSTRNLWIESGPLFLDCETHILLILWFSSKC